MLRWYYWASIFFILQATEAFNIADRLVYGEWQEGSGDTLTRSLNLLFIFTSIALFCRGFRGRRSIQRGSILAIGLTGFLLFSVLWSVDPQRTTPPAVMYLFVVVGAIGIAGFLDGDEFMDLIALVCFLTGVASLILVHVSPLYAFGQMGDFHGIFSQKNVLGQAMAVGALASMHGLRAGKRKRLRSAACLTLVSIVALKSESATSCLTIFVFCCAAAAIALIQAGGTRRILGLCAGGLLLPMAVYVAAFPELLLETVGKDPTLTGRTDIWINVLPKIYQEPWLGWGYGAFWSPNNRAEQEIAEALHVQLPQAHNGLLEMLLNVGVIGTGFFIFLWVRNVRLALQCMRTPEKAMAMSCLLSCAGVILVGISEMVLIAPFAASTSIFFITGLMCERAVRTARLRRHSAPVRRRFQASVYRLPEQAVEGNRRDGAERDGVVARQGARDGCLSRRR
jgi:exopolysaccharide production protein ExoQ